jgi:hypothetical protein
VTSPDGPTDGWFLEGLDECFWEGAAMMQVAKREIQMKVFIFEVVKFRRLKCRVYINRRLFLKE